MRNSEEFFRLPSVEEVFRRIREEITNAQRPAKEVILDESDFIRTLKISKRQAAKMRAEGVITYSKIGGKLYYRLSDILEYLDRHEVKSVYYKNRLLNPKKNRYED
jgi:3-methyladenine DNA glycosylase Tag